MDGAKFAFEGRIFSLKVKKICRVCRISYFCILKNTVVVAQLVRALVCGAGGRGFEPHHPPKF